MLLTSLKGIGDKTEKLFLRAGVHDTRELLMYFPRNYDIYKDPVLINEIDSEDTYAVYVSVFSNVETKTIKKLVITNVYCVDEKGSKIKLTWFNMPFLKARLVRGSRFIVRGKVKYSGAMIVMEQPTMYTPAEYESKLNSMQPIYPLVKGLSNNAVMKAVKQCFELGIDDDLEYIPDEFINKYGLMPITNALEHIHFPVSESDMLDARKRFVFDEFFTFMLKMNRLKESKDVLKNDFNIYEHPETLRLISELPFELTEPQNRTYKEVLSDLISDKVMNRLIQGDVGSGKTIIAVLSIVNTCLCGYQAALMAPTEVLAKQHYDYVNKLFTEHNIDIKPVLLVGSMSAKEKKEAKLLIASGEAGMVIGTHALIQDSVEYKNLALVVTDEQHRFGVKQRVAIAMKGNLPNVCVMSATPIPRTLAIILYGDLDISIIDVLPNGRKPIKNAVVDESYRPNAYKFIKNQINAGHQAYVICPMIAASETSESQNVEEYVIALRESIPEVRIAGLHGELSAEYKEKIMESFSNGEIDVLVSTTVIEVGINVPNATVMLIENAEKFGLAQLHQLRGRVGRGSDQSYCIFVGTSKKQEAKDRLAIIGSSNDGFKIAEEDLKLRGPGDFFGIRQSGEMSFKIADIYTDSGTLKMAKDMADYVFEHNLVDEFEKCFAKDDFMLY